MKSIFGIFLALLSIGNLCIFCFTVTDDDIEPEGDLLEEPVVRISFTCVPIALYQKTWPIMIRVCWS